MHRRHEDTLIPFLVPLYKYQQWWRRSTVYHRSCASVLVIVHERKVDSCLSRYGRYRRWKVKGSLADRLLIDWKHHAKRLSDSPTERGSCKLMFCYFHSRILRGIYALDWLDFGSADSRLTRFHIIICV